MAVSTSDQISALGQDSAFRSRVQSLLLQQAEIVYAEDPATPNHSVRTGFARSVLLNPGGFAANVAILLATRTNIANSNITYNFADGHVVTDATDAAISSQLATDWNMLAGV